MAALVLVIAGFGFKVSAVPFHAWAPDVYEGAPTPVTAFMSVGVKAGAFAGFLKLFVVAAAPQWHTWADVLIVVAVLTMVVGNVLALPQRNLKRLLAYSSIAHAGYLLLGLIAVGRSGTTDGSSAVLVYLGAYTFMNLGAFGMLVYLRNRSAFGYTLDEMAGLGRSRPMAALGLSLFMLSLTGIPPTAGFWGKFYLFTAVVNAHLTWLAVVAVVMSAVSAFYYLRVVWYMYFREAPAEAGRGRRRIDRRVAAGRGRGAGRGCARRRLRGRHGRRPLDRRRGGAVHRHLPRPAAVGGAGCRAPHPRRLTATRDRRRPRRASSARRRPQVAVARISGAIGSSYACIGYTRAALARRTARAGRLQAS